VGLLCVPRKPNVVPQVAVRRRKALSGREEERAFASIADVGRFVSPANSFRK
jgi:hypothetical protein